MSVALERFTADFLQFSNTTFKTWILSCWLWNCYQFQALEGFSEIF